MLIYIECINGQKMERDVGILDRGRFFFPSVSCYNIKLYVLYLKKGKKLVMLGNMKANSRMV